MGECREHGILSLFSLGMNEEARTLSEGYYTIPGIQISLYATLDLDLAVDRYHYLHISCRLSRLVAISRMAYAHGRRHRFASRQRTFVQFVLWFTG